MPGVTIADELDREELETEAHLTEPERSSPGWVEWLKSEPGPGEVESYLSHPLNWDGSLPVARLLRGLTGLAGNLRLAIVDLVVGSLQLVSRRPPGPPAGGGTGGMAGA